MSGSITKDLTKGDALMLHAELMLPQAEFATRRAKTRVEHYYRRLAEGLVRRCERTLYPAAVNEYHLCEEQGREFAPFSLKLDCSVRENTDELVSILLTLREKTIAREAFSLCCGDSWRARTGFAIPPSELMDTRSGWKKRLLPQLRAAADEYARRGEFDFYDGLETLMRRSISQYNIFVEAGRTVLFFQPGILAPAAQGAVFFPLTEDEKTGAGE